MSLIPMLGIDHPLDGVDSVDAVNVAVDSLSGQNARNRAVPMRDRIMTMAITMIAVKRKPFIVGSLLSGKYPITFKKIFF